MYYKSAPQTVSCNDHYNKVDPISNFADIGDKKDHASSQRNMSSFQNSIAANLQEERPKPNHYAFNSIQMIKANSGGAAETRRSRLPSNDFSQDFMLKMKKGDHSPNEQTGLKDIMGNLLNIEEEERDQTEFAFED